jgi:hypothetical protein
LQKCFNATKTPLNACSTYICPFLEQVLCGFAQYGAGLHHGGEWGSSEGPVDWVFIAESGCLHVTLLP